MEILILIINKKSVEGLRIPMMPILILNENSKKVLTQPHTKNKKILFGKFSCLANTIVY
jgi:hypothetical protein